MKKTIRFKYESNDEKHGLAMVFDLAGFTRFVNQPDVDDYHITEYLNVVFEAIDICLFGGVAYWGEDDTDRKHEPLLIEPYSEPAHVKFLGDGALYLWVRPIDESDFDQEFILCLLNRLASLKQGFEDIVNKCPDDVLKFNVPKTIRFGLARGKVYKLARVNGFLRRHKEYVGSCINLASRLQSYCRELGFIASAQLQLSKKDLGDSGYSIVTAKKIAGFLPERVIVDEEEYENLSQEVKSELFE